jgi:hypothetical protein
MVQETSFVNHSRWFEMLQARQKLDFTLQPVFGIAAGKTGDSRRAGVSVTPSRTKKRGGVCGGDTQNRHGLRRHDRDHPLHRHPDDHKARLEKEKSADPVTVCAL